MKKFLIFLLLPLTSFAQKNYPAMLDSFMLAEVSINNFNGNVLVAKSGNIIYQKAFGYRNYDTKETLDNNSVFELQSITKQFTGLSVLLLIEKGKLNLKDTLSKFFPELPYKNVTIQNLLSHTSGLPDDLDVMSQYWNHEKVAFNKDLLHILAIHNVPPHFAPGKRVEYSNTAFEILASIIEKVSGLSYAKFLQQNIFTPLAMRSSHIYTTTHAPKQDIPNFAYGYIYSDSLKRYILPALLPELDFVVYSDGIGGAGNISSTTGDLLKWDRALKNHTLLSKAMQIEMLSPQSVCDTASNVYWGYGSHKLGKNDLGEYIIGGGGWPGYAHNTIYYPNEDLTIIILSNNETDSKLLTGALAYIVTDRQVVAPYKHKSIVIDASFLNRYVGNYIIPYVPNKVKIELYKKDSKLYCRYDKGRADIELKPESTVKFFTDNNVDQQIEFQVDETGKVVKAFSIFHGMKKEIEKVN
jgi:CubicO group peptidase (beta-lactamase class C family)